MLVDLCRALIVVISQPLTKCTQLRNIFLFRSSYSERFNWSRYRSYAKTVEDHSFQGLSTEARIDGTTGEDG